MENVPFTVAEIKRQAKLHRTKPPGDQGSRNFKVLVDADGKESTFAIKMSMNFGCSTLRIELSILNYLSDNIKSNNFVTSKGYGLIDDGLWELLVMEFLEGETVWEIMKKGQRSLSNKDADDIAAAYVELRTSLSLESSKLTPYGGWNPLGHVFPFDNDGGRYLEDRRDFESFMCIRLENAGISLADMPLFPYVFTSGDISPYNVKRLPDGRLGLFDWDMTAWLPAWWELGALILSPYDEAKYKKPLLNAFERRGIVVGESFGVELLKLHHGIALWGAKVLDEEASTREVKER